MSASKKLSRYLREQGLDIEAQVSDNANSQPVSFPQINVARARRGFIHPLSKSDITTLMKKVGPLSWYGLQEICLVQNSDAQGKLKFGALQIPGKILLYEQLMPPWFCAGSISQRNALEAAGAVLTDSAETNRIQIDWSEDNLRDFFLYDVLMHEVGHHIIQQFTGKRQAQVRRTKDHERFAQDFANECRRNFGDAPNSEDTI